MINENIVEEVPQTQADIVTSKQVWIDGKKVGGVQRLEVDLDLRDANLLTKVTVTFVVKRNSLHIEDIEGKPGLQKVSFSTINEAFK